MMEESFDHVDLEELRHAVKSRMIARGRPLADSVRAVDQAIEDTVQELRERGDL